MQPLKNTVLALHSLRFLLQTSKRVVVAFGYAADRTLFANTVHVMSTKVGFYSGQCSLWHMNVYDFRHNGLNLIPLTLASVDKHFFREL